MGKIAFVFSGQGDQYPGMGKDIYDKYPEAKEIFDRFEAIRHGTLNQCFEGSEDELKETVNTQPCLFALETAYSEILNRRGIKADMTAGFSLGEVSALTYSGIVNKALGFELVIRRAELMQEAASKIDAFMAAVLKLNEDELLSITDRYDNIYPVNFNCPGQITVSGLKDNMQEFFADVKKAGGRAVPLKVKGAFHSPFMNEAANEFKKELDKINFNFPLIPLYSNVTACPYQGDIAYLLSKQIASPVKWESIIRNMINAGCDTFIEIGPGKTLTNMIKKIDVNVKAYSVSDLDQLLSEAVL